jgi:hypothetical protein
MGGKMIRRRTLVLVAVLSLGWASLEAAGSSLKMNGVPAAGTITVGYFTDGATSSTGFNAPITANGYTAVQIADIATFDLSTIQVLLMNESNNGSPSAAWLARASDIANWVHAGGVIGIHDRNVCAGTCTPVPGSSGIIFTRSPGSNIDVETGGTLVTSGPGGIITNTTLDGGNFSDHGYSGFATLPPGAIAFLNNGTTGQEVAFAYRFGSGSVYYSTIPLDYYLSGSTPAAFAAVYAPNMIAYLGSLVGARSVAVASVPALSEWGLAMLAILLMGFAAFQLRSRRGERVN